MTQLLLLTFNCAKLDQLGAHLDEHISRALPEQCPDLLVFGFQELMGIIESTSHVMVDGYLSQLAEVIRAKVSEKYGVDVFLVSSEHLGAIGSFVLSPHDTALMNASTSSASCGMFYSSLKGGVGIRLRYSGEEYTFVTAHLSANEGNVERRNADYWRIVTAMDFGDGFSVFKPGVHTFFMGDLNYRALRQTDESDQALLRDNDELSRVLEGEEAFVGLHEEEITFKPTYKYHVGTKRYNRKRIPSWCDRVVFSKYKPGEYTVWKYGSLDTVVSSDHEPVYLQLEIKGKPEPVVDSQGVLTLSDGSVRDLKVSTASQYENYLRVAADAVIGGTMYCATTRNGRVTVGAAVVLLFLLRWLWS